MICTEPSDSATDADRCRACGSSIQRTGVIDTSRAAGAHAPVGYCPMCRNLQLLVDGAWSPMGPAHRRDR